MIVPIGLVGFTKDFDKNEKIRQEEKLVLEVQEDIELEQKKYDSARNKALDTRYRIPKEIDKAEFVDSTCILSKEDIEKYNITDEEIAKFEKDRELAIIEYKDKNMVQSFEKKAKE